MQFHSTRDPSHRAGFAAALRQGLAPDGGLYVPEQWPDRRADVATAPAALAAVGQWFIAPFATDDALAPELGAITSEAFNFPAPRVSLDAADRYSVLELFQGPTAAFKDFGARFLAACFERINRGSGRVVNILVATSGDTGGAVAAAFHRRAGLRVTVLYPKGLVSPTQERQLTCWGDNVTACAVRGTFDDCQALVKQAFVDPQLRARFELSSANSINLGRLLPQAVYYAATSLAAWRRHGEKLNFIVPSGNLGNVYACVMARLAGLPIGEIVLAHNANRTVVDYLSTGHWQPRPSVATLASAMDVGNPSNMERLRHLFPDIDQLRGALRAETIDDDAIRARIRSDATRLGQVWCPHTATAAEVYARLPERARQQQRWCIVATAHPAKFPEIVEPLIGRPVTVPDTLAALFSRPTHAEVIDADLGALRAVLAASEAGS